MFLLTLLAVAVVSVPLAGGRLTRLADVRFRRGGLLLAAFGLQVVAMALLPDTGSGWQPWAHILSYVAAGGFVLANRHVPGLWLVGIGGLLNFVAIAANDGVMPASARALEIAGRPVTEHGFVNSGWLPHAELAFLGDVFALPASLPMANVFSIGDVVVVLGATVALHGLCGSRLMPSRTTEVAELRALPGYRRTWTAQAVSLFGDWMYALAAFSALVGDGAGAAGLAGLLLAQVVPALVVGGLGGPLLDRLPRRRLLVGADLVRAGAVASLLLAGGSPSLVHLASVAVVLGTASAVFDPTLQAALPDLVPRRLLDSANGLLSATHNLAVMTGPPLGGLVAAQLGLGWAFAANAASFGVSAALLMSVRLPRPRPSEGRHMLADLAEGIRYVVGARLVRGVLVVVSTIMLAAALKAPVEPLLAFEELRAGAGGLGLMTGAWGIGMVAGALAAPAVARRLGRPRALAASAALVGVAICTGAIAGALVPVLLLWGLAGLGNGVGSVAYETLLQERTPAGVRGRVLAAVEAACNGGYLLGLLLAGGCAAALGTRGTLAVCGCAFLLAAAAAWRMLVHGAREGVPRALVPVR